MGKKQVSKKIRNIVMMRNSFKCTKCGTTNKLTIHHIKPMESDDPEFEDPDNLTLLCKSCHVQHHWKEGDIIGRKNFTNHCQVDGCNRVHYSKLLCKRHYDNWRYRNYDEEFRNKLLEPKISAKESNYVIRV